MPESADERAWQEHRGSLLDSVKGFDVIDCVTCGFKHAVPIPTPDELRQVYRHEYYTAEKPRYLQHVKEDLDWWNLVYAEEYDTLEELLPDPNRRILDIGSGPGYFLLFGKHRGWKTVGIEPSVQAAAHSRDLGLEIVEDFLTEKTAMPLGKFDAIHLREVLEHIPDPAEMLCLAARMLTPGGILCIVVPNDYNPFQYALRVACSFQPWWVAPPHHLNYFDFNSLETLVRRCGFEVVRRECTFPIDLFLLFGDDYVGNDFLGRECHAKRKRLERNLARAGLGSLKRKLYMALADQGLGREIVLFTRLVRT